MHGVAQTVIKLDGQGTYVRERISFHYIQCTTRFLIILFQCKKTDRPIAENTGTSAALSGLADTFQLF